MKRAFTLVELLVVIAIIGILLALIIPGCTNWASEEQSFKATIIRKWERHWNEDTYLMLDVKKPNGQVIVLSNYNSLPHSKWNSITLQAQLELDRTYNFKTKGSTNEALGWFPNVIEAHLIK